LTPLAVFLRLGLVIVNLQQVNEDNIPSLFTAWNKIGYLEIIEVGNSIATASIHTYLGGGFHGITLDVYRTGTLKNYS
jgi:hypothetical protein